MTDKEKIIANIERLKSLTGRNGMPEAQDYYKGKNDAYNSVLRYIKSLPAEQPSEELVEAFDEVLPNPNWYISNDGEDAYNVKQMEEMFCAGAQWQKDKLLNKACKWLNKNVVEYHPRKGELRPIVNINAFREAMEKEDEQCSTE